MAVVEPVPKAPIVTNVANGLATVSLLLPKTISYVKYGEKHFKHKIESLLWPKEIQFDTY